MLDVAHLVPSPPRRRYFSAIYTHDAHFMPDAAQQDYVKRREPGPGRVSQRRHVLRNALLPIIMLAGLQAGQW